MDKHCGVAPDLERSITLFSHRFDQFVFRQHVALLLSREASFEEVLAGLMPVARSSLGVREVRAQGLQVGQEHPACLFVYREGGKQHSRHVPVALAPLMRRAVENGKRLEQAMCAEGLRYLDSLAAGAR